MKLTRTLQGDTHHAILWGVISFIRKPHCHVGEHPTGPHLRDHPALVIEPIIVRVPISIRPPARTIFVIVVIAQCTSSGIYHLQKSTLAIVIIGGEPHRLLTRVGFLILHPNRQQTINPVMPLEFQSSAIATTHGYQVTCGLLVVVFDPCTRMMDSRRKANLHTQAKRVSHRTR